MGVYDKTIDNNTTAVISARTKAAQKAKHADCATYKTAQLEMTQFVLTVVADTWVQELQDAESIYTEVSPKDLFSNLQAGSTVRNVLNLLSVHNEMQRYHLEFKGIPEYINMFQDAQMQSGWAGQKISDNTLLLFASTEMLTTERFPHANNDWSERAERDKTWMQPRVAYKKAHAQEMIKEQANYGNAKFCAANSAAHQDTTRPTVDHQLEVEDGDIKALEGYFDNLAATAVIEKSVLQQLALNNTTLARSNESLVALVKN